ncbi:MAG: hypothetical protein SFV23_12205, partial [Planctomycetaceae bacterium]|nr:hypothetical protein [Planctomycetaceae bacterium]
LGDLARIEAGSEGLSTVVIPGDRPDRSAVLREVLARLEKSGVHVERIETQQSNLERLFLQLTGNRLRD